MDLTALFTVEGQPLPAPDQGVQCNYEDLDSHDAGRDEAGFMHRSLVRSKVGSWTFSYSHLTEPERAYLEGLFPPGGTFTFGHPDRLDSTKTVTCTAYRSKYNLAWFNARLGLWKNYSFTIIEC